MSWEFHNDQDMYSQLVGQYYGAKPENKQIEIRNSRYKIAQSVASFLNLKPSDVIMDLGSGLGDMAQYLSKQAQHVHCADISQSFLAAAKENCKNVPNISFHHLQSHRFDFLPEQSLDAIYSHAVFIHLNIYDFYLYLKNFARILKTRGRIYIDFLSTDGLNFTKSEHFSEHVENYSQHPDSLPTLLSFHSEKAILNMARELGYFSLFRWRGPDHTVVLVLQKRNGLSSIFDKIYVWKYQAFVFLNKLKDKLMGGVNMKQILSCTLVLCFPFLAFAGNPTKPKNPLNPNVIKVSDQDLNLVPCLQALSKTQIWSRGIVPLDPSGKTFFVKLQDGTMRVMGEMEGEKGPENRYYILENYRCTSKMNVDRMFIMQELYTRALAFKPVQKAGEPPPPEEDKEALKETLRKACRDIPLDFEPKIEDRHIRTMDR